MALSPADIQSLAYKVPGYVAGTMSITAAAAQVVADYNAINPPPTTSQLATTVVWEVNNTLPTGTDHRRGYGDGHVTRVNNDGSETVITAAPASAPSS